MNQVDLWHWSALGSSLKNKPFPFPELLFKMDRLPVELLEKVFDFLPYQDRKTVVLVNSHWRKAGEAAHLWDWVGLPRVEDQRSCKRVIEMLNTRRLAKAKEIAIQTGAMTNDLLQAVVLHKGLKEMEIGGLRLVPAGVDRQLLVEALTGVESLDLQTCALPSQVLIALLTKVASGCSLNELYLHAKNKEQTLRMEAWRMDRMLLLSSDAKVVPAALMASAFTRMTKVHVTHTILSSSQVGALMDRISQDNSSLNNLSLVGSFHRSRTERLDLKHLVHLEEVRLVVNYLTSEELVDFFEALSPLTKLKKLDLENIYGPSEDENGGITEMMAKAINFLEEAKINIFGPTQVRFQI